MAILKSGKPTRIAIHHSAVRYNTGDLAELRARASSHNNYHRANSVAWNNTTPGEFGYQWIRYHYMISAQGHLLQVQDDKYVLYANGDGTGANSFNRTAINIMFEGNFSEQHPTDAMMKTAVKLIRDIEKKYNIDPPVRGHREISGSGTACPGNNMGTSQGGWLKQLIANINDKNYPPPEDWRDEAIRLPEKTKYVFNKDSALFEIDTGKRVSEFKKGTEIEVDYQFKNFFLTAWSFDRKIKNGFRAEDLELYKEPTPEPEPPPEAPKPCSKCKEYEKQVLDLQEENDDLRIALKGLENQLQAESDKYSKLKDTNKELEVDVLELEKLLKKEEDLKLGWMEKYENLKKKMQGEQENFIEKIVDWVREVLGNILSRD